jgi:hypothetical protein
MRDDSSVLALGNPESEVAPAASRAPAASGERGPAVSRGAGGER